MPPIVSPDCCTESGKGCLFWFFQKPIVAGQPVPPQVNVGEFEPLMTIALVEPEFVNVAEPVTSQSMPSGALGQFTATVLVTFVAVAVKEILPGTVVVVPPQLSVKV